MYFEQELSVHVHDMEIPKSFSNKKRVYAFDRIVEVMHDLPELKDAFSHLDYVKPHTNKFACFLLPSLRTVTL